MKQTVCPFPTLRTVKTPTGEVSLVAVSLKQLGFCLDTDMTEVSSRARKFGLDLCPSELIPVIRNEDKKHPMGEWFKVLCPPVYFDGFLLIHYAWEGYDEIHQTHYCNPIQTVRVTKETERWLFVKQITLVD
jgi:hypothetical protein